MSSSSNCAFRPTPSPLPCAASSGVSKTREMSPESVHQPRAPPVTFGPRFVLLFRFRWWRCRSGSSIDSLPEKRTRDSSKPRRRARQGKTSWHLVCPRPLSRQPCLSWVFARSRSTMDAPQPSPLSLRARGDGGRGGLVGVVAQPVSKRKIAAFFFLVDDADRRERGRERKKHPNVLSSLASRAPFPTHLARRG